MGHLWKKTTRERKFWERVVRGAPDECWIWTGGANAGYGRVWLGEVPGDRRTVAAHRISYEMTNGPIPAGMVIDHRCRITLCVNPAHMDAVTIGENTRRGILARRVCRRGHPKPADRLLRYRQCLTCKREDARRRMPCEACGKDRAYPNLRWVDGRRVCRAYLRCEPGVIAVEHDDPWAALRAAGLSEAELRERSGR